MCAVNLFLDGEAKLETGAEWRALMSWATRLESTVAPSPIKERMSKLYGSIVLHRVVAPLSRYLPLN